MDNYLGLAMASMALLLLLMVLYAFYIVKLRWHLEEHHEAELEKLNLGKKVSRLVYYSTPRQAKNVMKFIFSDHHLDDPKVKSLKQRLRIVIRMAIVMCLIFISAIIFYSTRR